VTPWAPQPACPVCRRLGCTEHRRPRPHSADEAERHRRRGDPGDARRRREFVDQWLARYGSPGPEPGTWAATCPACGRLRVLPRRDWTADHVRPLALGGDPGGPLRVMCRRCASRQGARLRGRGSKV
jgi:hypothetical protein